MDTVSAMALIAGLVLSIMSISKPVIKKIKKIINRGKLTDAQELKILLLILNHMIDGNNTEALKKTRNMVIEEICDFTKGGDERGGK